MKKKFKEYLDDIKVAEPIQERVGEIIDFYEGEILRERIRDIFVTNIVKKDNTHVYEDLWLFSKNFIMEAKNFINADIFGEYLSDMDIVHWEIRRGNFEDLENPTPDSKMYLDVKYQWPVGAQLKASGHNCKYLWDIFKSYFYKMK